jgi:hypothetical protein
LGKKKATYKQFPSNKGRMMPLPQRKTLTPAVTERKAKIKHDQEMRSREFL